MFLYENNGKFIDVYKLEPKLDKIKEYKMSEMRKIPSNERVWMAVTNDCDLRKLEKINISSSYSDLNIRGKRYDFDYFHLFRPSNNVDKNLQFLEWYYDDEDFIYNLCKIRRDSKYMYILRLQDEYNLPVFNADEYIMDGIMNVTESLYLLEALLQEKFNLIGDNNVTEQLKLFDIQHYGRINTSVLKNICEYKLLTDSYESIINRTKGNENVVSKVKNLLDNEISTVIVGIFL